jgi:hypothetical protein
LCLPVSIVELCEGIAAAMQEIIENNNVSTVDIDFFINDTVLFKGNAISLKTPQPSDLLYPPARYTASARRHPPEKNQPSIHCG